jgi:hypothetical protein
MFAMLPTAARESDLPDVRLVGSKAGPTAPKSNFRFAPDIVAKVENRTSLKISRKSIFGLLCCCVAFQHHYGDFG